jgi:hypothetical protein
MKVVRKLALGLLLAAALAWMALSASAQSQPGFPTANPAGYQNLFGQPNPHQWQSESAQLAKQYVDAKKEEDKTSIRKRLTETLGQQFDQHLQEQQKELDDLEKQIAHVKAVLKKRLDAKSTIVERRAEQLIQDAEGLGWNAPGGPQVGSGDYWDYPRSTPKSPMPKTTTTPQVK